MLLHHISEELGVIVPHLFDEKEKKSMNFTNKQFRHTNDNTRFEICFEVETARYLFLVMVYENSFLSVYQ